MYLIHVHLKGPPGAALPAGIECLVRSSAHAADRLEHVVAHRRARPYSVLGLFVIAERAEEARSVAYEVCRRVLADSGGLLREWELVGAELPVTPPPDRWPQSGRPPAPG
ncbi:hypothetical protein [Streptomyces sp. NPDC002088]|uniref:hypothetical protein n=1 Tax=Streptomyces sp. NPDC002088 TaxID=3154665 RepID=UPI0033249D52